MTNPKDINKLYVNLLQQTEEWRDGSGVWVKIKNMDQQHLENTIKYLEDHSSTYRTLSRNRTHSLWNNSGALTGSPKRVRISSGLAWMRDQPLYIQLKEELATRVPPLFVYAGERYYGPFPSPDRMAPAMSHAAQAVEQGRFPVTITDVAPGQIGRQPEVASPVAAGVGRQRYRYDAALDQLETRVRSLRTASSTGSKRLRARRVRSQLDRLEELI